MVLVLAVCLFTYFKQRDHLVSENHFEGVVSREASFLFNNMILLVACATVLIGTLFPVLSEYVQGTKTTIQAPYYNVVEIPVGLFLLFLTGLGPLLAWRSTSLRSIRRNFILPGIAFGATLIALMIGGVRPWNVPDDWTAEFFSLLAFSLGAGVITAISAEFLRGANVVRTQTGQNLIVSMGTLMRRNTRRYGGYLVHFGIVVLFIGIAGGAFNQSHEVTMGFGDETSIGPYRLVCQSYTQDSNANYDTDFAVLDVYKHGQKTMQLFPEKRFYHASQTYSTIVALHSTAQADLYVIFMGRDPDTNKPIVKVFLNPLISWIWIGVLIVVLGTMFALAPSVTGRRRELTAPAASPVKIPAEIGVQGA
jgi:cytochrome c-type biogenesis protein CcmF